VPGKFSAAACLIAAALGFLVLADASPRAFAQSNDRFIKACTMSIQRQTESSDAAAIAGACRCLRQTLDAHGYGEQVRAASNMYVRRDGVEYYEFRGPRTLWTGGTDMSLWRPSSSQRESYSNATLACVQSVRLPRRFFLIHDSVLQQSPAEARIARIAEFDAIVSRAGLDPANAGRRYRLNWKSEQLLTQAYPPRALEREQSGLALLRVTVDGAGMVTQSEVVFEEPAGWGWGLAAQQGVSLGALARPVDGGAASGQGLMLVRFRHGAP